MDDQHQFHSKSLHKTSDPNVYKLYRAALEWDLIEPILIRDRDDLKSESKWRDKLEPYHHQIKNLIAFCRRLPVTLLADDVGLGKTISAGLVMSELMARHRISKILVVCPKLLMPQWQEELDTKFGIPSVIATGKELANVEPPKEGGAVITTYHSARIYLDALVPVGFDMLILDEAHKLRNLYGTEHAPQVAERFRKALADRTFKYVLMLTATPIQNRLWDIYSLVDLLTVARGHQNPFGTPGMFARTFIGDNRTDARRLNPAMQEQFRSIVYGYMSRMRRADANLHFPERIVQMHRVDPTPEELELINLIAEPIQKLNRLAQISILQALISSPHALDTQLRQMAANKTVPESLAMDVHEVVSRITLTAKLRGLGILIDKLKKENPDDWRAVIFTTRRETQTTIEAFLGERGISCGLINGDSGVRNQETIANLKKNPPEIHVIVSTEAGAEGVNLQAANVLVNFDLPWNPMVVEQRIGRIQRLASSHANVAIFNIVLRGTFEEYIVGRLMEKLQLASHAIGDIEALLEASGMGEQEENGADGFEEMIRKLVVASLAGKDVETATKKAEKSIADAKVELEREEKNIDTMLGAMDGNAKDVPFPRLPEPSHVMEAYQFISAALSALDLGGETASSEDYEPGSPQFTRLVGRIVSTGLHRVDDGDSDIAAKVEGIARRWVESFGAKYVRAHIRDTERSFEGVVLARVRATVAHDSYERLVEIPFSLGEYWRKGGSAGMNPLSDILDNPEYVGVDAARILEKAESDEGISEFCCFYRARLAQEVQAAGSDLRKQKKIEDDFTPRLDVLVVGAEGIVRRKVEVDVAYQFESGPEYMSTITVIPSADEIVVAPEMGRCSLTGNAVPCDCLGRCAITGVEALQHLLEKSEISGRMAVPKEVVICAMSGKYILSDEAEQSSITGKLVAKDLLRTSGVSGKRAEPEFFGACEFTGIDALKSELATSQISGKRYRLDQELRSVVSGKAGHEREFIRCAESNQPLLSDEAERCEVTSAAVAPGILEMCEVSGKKVLPSELERSAATGKKALKRYFVTSSISGAHIFEQEAVRSMSGKYCAPQEAKMCLWGGVPAHPDDLRICGITGVPIHFQYASPGSDGQVRLDPLINLLNGTRKKADHTDIWPTVEGRASGVLGKKVKAESAEFSPDKNHLAIVLEVHDWLGMRTRHAGLLYSLADGAIDGRIVLGKRGSQGWSYEKSI